MNLEQREEATGGRPIRIDIPVILKEAKIVYNVDNLLMWGDAPFAIVHMGLIVDHFREHGTRGEFIAVFHSAAGHVTLDDRAYNASRVVGTGNPYKALIATLVSRGAKVELCGATATANHWVNEDLLPGVRVNTNAMVRIVQLVHAGYGKSSSEDPSGPSLPPLPAQRCHSK